MFELSGTVFRLAHEFGGKTINLLVGAAGQRWNVEQSAFIPKTKKPNINGCFHGILLEEDRGY
jgi:hypothetical protein